MSGQLAGAVFLPLLGALLVMLCGRWPNRREAVSLVIAALTLLLVLSLLPAVVAGERPTLTLFVLAPGLPLQFTLEPLGMLFALVAAGLWPLSAVYSIGYMRGNHEKNQTRFYACFAVAVGSAIGVAFAGNLLTLFVFYEVLSLSTYPLVTHKGNAEALRAGRVYLGILLGTSIGLLLLAIVWTWTLAGTLEFQPGGILPDTLAGPALGLLLGLYAFGIGKAALMPFHAWLPRAMVAPTPVSALLHAVAVVKAGVFTVVKVVVYVFGVERLAGSGMNDWLVWVAAFTLLMASLIALTKDNLKARLAYSTVSQLAYVVLGAALASAAGVLGAALHIAMHAVGKITLFFCAGAIYTATHKTEVSQLDGLGRVMPWTFGAFTLAALSIIGLPPLGGAWSKWLLLSGAADAGQGFVVFVLLASSLLNIAYLLPIAIRGFFRSPAEPVAAGIREAPLTCVVPLCLTALGCVLLFFFADALYALLASMITAGGSGHAP